MHLAIQEGHERIVELLVNVGSDLSYKLPNNGSNAIDLASKLGQKRIEKFLKVFSCHKRIPQQIPGILDGPEKANKLSLSQKKVAEIDVVLKDLNLTKYSPCFQAMNFEEFKKLTDNDLKDLGVSLIGPRRKLSSKIASLN